MQAVLVGVVILGVAAISLAIIRLRSRRPSGVLKPGGTPRLVEPGLAAPLRDRTRRSKRGRRSHGADPRSNGHEKRNGHDTLR